MGGDCVDFILDIILLSVWSLDSSKPIERTWKGFAAMMGAVLLSSAAACGLGIIIIFQSYIWGIILISASIGIAVLWSYIYKRLHKYTRNG